MKSRHRVCGHCRRHLKKFDRCETFLLPKKTGEIRITKMHINCLEKWNALATTREYSKAFFRETNAA